VDAGLIAMRMRLSGGKEVAAEAETATAAVKETSAATEAANAKVAKSGGAIRSSLARQITSIRTIGRALTKYVAIPLAAVAIGSGVMAAHFDRSMNLIATDAGGSVKEVGRLKSEVLDMARHSQFGPQALADSLFHVESSGYRGAKALRVLNEAQRLATTGNSDLQTTTYALVSATKALYGESLKNVNRTAAELNGIVAHGDMRLEELTSAMSTGVLPKAKAMGLTLRDVGAAMDVMTARGIPAQRAAYALGFTLQKLVPYGEKAEDAFKSIGLGEETLINAAQKGPYGYVSALELLQKHLDRLPTKAQQTKVIEEMFGGGRMTSGLLTNLQNLGEMKKIYGELGDEVQKYNHHVHEAENQPMVRAQRAWSSIEAGLIEIGEVLLPAAIPLMEHFAGILSGIAHGFAALPHSTQHTIVVIGVLAAALGPILLMVAKLLEMWKAIRELALISAISQGVGELTAAGQLAAGGELGGFGMMSAKGRLVTGAVGVAGSQVLGNAIGGKGGELVSNIGSGAAIGFGLGGPMGAAVGATAGAVATAIGSIFATEKKLGPLQGRVAASAEHLNNALKRQHTASSGLTAATQRLFHAQHNHNLSINGVKKAQAHLNAVVAEYGLRSRPAIHAEARLIEEINKHRDAIRRLHNAEKLRGVALSAYKTETDQTVLAERHRINSLKALRERQSELFVEARKANPMSERTRELAHNLLTTEGKLSEAVKQHAGTIQEAAAKAGPKYAHFLQHARAETLKWGNAFKQTMEEGRRFAAGMERLSERLGGMNFAPEEPSFNVPSLPIPQHHHGGGSGGGKGPHSKNAENRLQTNGSEAVRLMLERGARPKTVTHRVPAQLVLAPNGKRILAEGVVEVQEDEEARE